MAHSCLLTGLCNLAQTLDRLCLLMSAETPEAFTRVAGVHLPRNQPHTQALAS